MCLCFREVVLGIHWHLCVCVRRPPALLEPWMAGTRAPLEEWPGLPDVGVAHAAARGVCDVLLLQQLVHSLRHHAHRVADVCRLILAVDELQPDDACGGHGSARWAACALGCMRPWPQPPTARPPAPCHPAHHPGRSAGRSPRSRARPPATRSPSQSYSAWQPRGTRWPRRPHCGANGADGWDSQAPPQPTPGLGRGTSGCTWELFPTPGPHGEAGDALAMTRTPQGQGGDCGQQVRGLGGMAMGLLCCSHKMP